MQSLQMGVNSEPPSVSVKKLVPVPEVICSINEDPEKIRENIRSNIKREIPQVEPHETQDKVIALAVGEPTLKDTFSDLIYKRDNGMPVVSVNGTHKYLCLIHI